MVFRKLNKCREGCTEETEGSKGLGALEGMVCARTDRRQRQAALTVENHTGLKGLDTATFGEQMKKLDVIIWERGTTLSVTKRLPSSLRRATTGTWDLTSALGAAVGCGTVRTQGVPACSLPL